MTQRPITDEELHALDLTQFNQGQNPHGDSSVYIRFNCDSRRKIISDLSCAGNERVLDLLCGFGSWLIFLAEMNQEVYGLDKNEGSIRIAQGLCDHFGLDNVKLVAGDVKRTAEYPDNFFDRVWIWNSLIYVDRGPTLDEVQRVLKPGGKAVIGAVNSTGRLIEKVVNNLNPTRPRNKNERAQALTAFRRGPHFEGCPNYFTRATAASVMSRHGLLLESVVPEGKMVWKFFPRNVSAIAVKA